VIGRHSAGGRSYTMFADGSVETETASGAERFPSLEALRKHLEAARGS
jgi:prepilin-type processing-associated H-X9-DG protein